MKSPKSPLKAKKILKTVFLPSFGLLATASFASATFSRPAFAQSAPPTGNQGFQTNEVDNFTGIEQGNFNPLDLIHRASMGPQRSMGEFREDGHKKLNDAAAQFREQQLQLLQQQRSNATNAAPVPALETP